MVYSALKFLVRQTEQLETRLPCTGMMISEIIKRSEPTALTLLADMEKTGLIKRMLAKNRIKPGIGYDVILTDYPLRWKEAFDKGELAAFDAAEAEKRQ